MPEQTTASPSSAANGAQASPATLRLVESTDGWRVELTLPPGELTDDAAEPITVDVSVEPNLVPGQPFAAELTVTRPQPQDNSSRPGDRR